MLNEDFFCISGCDVSVFIITFLELVRGARNSNLYLGS